MITLVTGGAGFIGSNLCEKLLNESFVICVDDFNDYYDPKIKENNIKECTSVSNFKLYKLDIRDLAGLKNIFLRYKVDNIIHLAARAGVRASFDDRELYSDVNINGTRNLLDLAIDHEVDKFIFGSSSSVYGTNEKMPFSEDDEINNIISPYAESKKKAELLCKSFHDKHGLKTTILRFFTVYGPRGRPDMAPYKFTKLISSDKEIEMYGDGYTKRDYTYITDIVDGILSALNKDFDFEIINLGNSNLVDLKYLIFLIERETGKVAKIKQLPMQDGDVPVTYADISKARKLLNFNPKVKIEEGIKDFVEWYKENGI